MKKIYVGNLSWNTSEQEMEDLFAEFGPVSSSKIILDRDTGRSRGFGFIEMEDDQAADEAMAALNEKEIDGRPLTVNEARPRQPRRGGGGGGGGGPRY